MWKVGVNDLWAFAQFTDETGKVTYHYKLISDYPFLEEAQWAAVDQVRAELRNPA